MKKQTSILISALLILALALIGVMLVRMRPVPTQETDPGSAEPPTQSETAGQKYADATGTAAPELSEHALAAERKPEADPKPCPSFRKPPM